MGYERSDLGNEFLMHDELVLYYVYLVSVCVIKCKSHRYNVVVINICSVIVISSSVCNLYQSSRQKGAGPYLNISRI